MRNRSCFFFAVFLLALSSCTQEPVVGNTQDQRTASVQVPEDCIPGVIRVKFKSEPTGTKAGGPDLSALANATMTRVFPPAGKAGPAE